MAYVKTLELEQSSLGAIAFASRLSEIQLCLHYDYKYVKFMNANRQQLEENRNVTVFDLIEM